MPLFPIAKHRRFIYRPSSHLKKRAESGVHFPWFRNPDLHASTGSSRGMILVLIFVIALIYLLSYHRAVIVAPFLGMDDTLKFGSGDTGKHDISQITVQ